MPFREAKSIDTLARETNDADLTFTSDPPLALALDRRVQRPQLGRVGATPRGHASNEFTPQDRRRLFERLVVETDLSWKQAHRALDYCLSCWDLTGELDTILEFEEFQTPAFRTTVETLRGADSSYHALSEMSIAADADIAVINDESLSPLDRSLLPDTYPVVDPFSGETTTVPEFHVFSSATAIVDSLINQLDAQSAESVGIVLDESTLFSPLVESALETAGIPYQGGPGFIDDDDIRTFLRLAEAAFAGSDLRVEEICPLVERMGVSVDRSIEPQRVDRGETIDIFEQIRSAVQGGTFREAIAVYERTAEVSLTKLRTECSSLGMLSEPLTSRGLDQLNYYLASFDVPIDRKRNGVLLTDGAATGYIDRPVVFYLGLGDGWAKTPPNLPWVDSKEYLQRDLNRFEILLQNGREQHFLVQNTRAGSAITPCVYFREVFDEPFEQFTDLPHTIHGRGTTREISGTPFIAPESAEEPEPPETISQSTLRRLANCPREEFFHRLVESPTTIPMARGTVIHEAAELYVAHPEEIRAQFDETVDAMLEQVRAYATTGRELLERTQLVLALEAAMAYIDAEPPEDIEYEKYAERTQENELGTRLGLEADSPLTERWFESPEIGLHGFVDILQSTTALGDYKTGSKKSASELRRSAMLDPLHETPNFQAAAYLAQQRREEPDEPLEIRFIHVLEHADQFARGDEVPIEHLVTTVEYLPCTFGEFAARREIFEAVTDYAETNDRVMALEPLGYDAYRSFFERHDLPRKGIDPDRRETITQAFIAYTKERWKDTKYVEQGCRKAIDDIDGLVGERYLKSDLDAFEAFVEEQRNRLGRYRVEGFPVRTREDGPNWDRVDTRGLVIDND